MWLLMGGRGGGKTRSGAEDISDFCRRTPGSRIALVAPTFADVRDTMVEGESGLLSVLPDAVLRGGSRERAWNRSIGELHLANGCHLKAFSSEKPGRLRGPQHHRAWVDEPAQFHDRHSGDDVGTTWNNLMLGLRLGTDPRVVATGTPESVRLYKEIASRADTHRIGLSTYDNLANLAPQFRDRVIGRYAGTRLERQELYGELLDDVEGALWQRAWIDDHRQPTVRAAILQRIVVSLDPAGGGKSGDEQAIVVCALGLDWRYYVLWSEGVRLSPDAWLRRAAALYHHYRADRILCEVNYGDRFLTSLARTVIGDLPLAQVRATLGKRLRAEPVSALYEQGRVSHVTPPSDPKVHHVLEDQMVSYTGRPGEVSPDRLDALVHGLTYLHEGAGLGPVIDRRPVEVDPHDVSVVGF